ncbi:spore germination protein [Clostridium sp. MSJ-4]|uniref:Spore germination protein n=1 Tax=Clostridium simiarum TaxID=2841506 RepID=A0ABS6F4S6_9CLOT|nr:spore germination protein [Clostridium simiarum]MBU5593410.1 spore germination protein [Clostridium simiarum]
MDILLNKLNSIVEELGVKNEVVSKRFVIGKNKINSMLVYINGLSDKTVIDRDILNPLMTKINVDIEITANMVENICENFIPISNTKVSSDINEVIEEIKSGKSIIFFQYSDQFIILDTVGGVYRTISDPENESSVRGTREGFVENLEVNVSILKRNLKDKNLRSEMLKIGKRSETNVCLLYIDDIVDKAILEELKDRLNKIDVDSIIDTGTVAQYIEDNTFSPFPQFYTTERPDIVQANMLQGKIALVISGVPNIMTAPAVFFEFFQAVEDYNQRTLVSNLTRFLRSLSIFLIITMSPLYLTLISYNVELVPIKFILPIVQSRSGIALTPFLEILFIELVVEFLREGGLRLPTRIAQTLSIVGGIIIGNTAVQSKVVSPSTLLVVGTSVVATFLIPNYQMSLSIRFLRFPMLILANAMGFLGLSVGWFFIVVHLCSLTSLGVPYLSFYSSDMKDILIRAPLWQMNLRPKSTPINDMVRQKNFRNLFRRNKNE